MQYAVLGGVGQYHPWHGICPQSRISDRVGEGLMLFASVQ